MNGQRKTTPTRKPKPPLGGTRQPPGVTARPGGRGNGGGGRGPRTKRGRDGKPRKPWTLKRVLKDLFITGLVMLVIVALGFVYAYNATDVPDENAAFKTQTSKVFYRGGKSEIGTFVDQNRESIPYSAVPKNVRDAVVAAEDRTFWTNNGIDPKGILRAAFSNAKGNSTQGASTITQQYVKILYLSSERTFKRKFKEAFVSLKLQRQKTKRQILSGYLNTIYFGRGAYGIQAAAQTYFRKDAKDLTIPEGAALAAILNSPGNLDPATSEASKERLMGRYQYVLEGMAKMEPTLYADKAADYEKALPTFPKVRTTQKYAGQKGFMLEMVRNELKSSAIGLDDSTIDGGGLRITTTFTKANMKAVKDGVDSQRPPGLKQLHIGAVSLDVKSGAVRGIYGGQDYLKSSFNWALKGGQPGSTFKAFAVAAALKGGFSLKDTFDGNSPYTFPDGSTVKNEGSGSGTSYGSQVSLTKATEESINTAFIDLTQSLPDGPQKIINTARSMGIPIDKTAIKPTSGISLGSERVGMLDMANGYATIADNGVEHGWYTVEKVVRASDNKTLYQAPHKGTDALDPDIAADTSYALQQVVTSGTGTAARAIDRPAAGKTGTATNDKDQVSSAWFIGYTPQLVTAVMYVRGDGNDQLDGYLPEYFGGSYPARTWAAIMGAALEGQPVEDFPAPANVDGTAPTDGHAPYVPPPPKPKPKPKPKPSKTPTPTPTPPAPIPTPEPPAPVPSTPPPAPSTPPAAREAG